MRVVDVLEQGIADGTHTGAQLYVSHWGDVVADLALGRARDDVEMRTDSMMTWFSMTKAVTAVAVAQQWERGALDVDDAVVCNGMPGRERHSARLDAISSAVYVDLGIAEADDPGRAKPFPTSGL